MLTTSRPKIKTHTPIIKRISSQFTLGRAASVGTDELSAILEAMDEGVISFDLDRRLRQMNRAAAMLLHLPSLPKRGDSIEDCVPYASVRSLVERVLVTGLPIEESFSIDSKGQALIQGYARPLAGKAKSISGVVVIFSDITRVRHLENVRRDFVANVSHELKTPITSIKGFVETLLDGAMSDAQSVEKFLRIVARQADRLNNIFEDLLTLARLEQQGDGSEIQLENTNLKKILEAVIQDHDSVARERNISISLNCPDTLCMLINARLLEQAVGNLVDNAVKYSDVGLAVEIEVTETEREVEIHVHDHGCGIRKDHLPRLWERFYRADPARSRKCGGTGLGLSIVKHISQAHGGYATVESTIGKGSTFTIHLPRVHKRKVISAQRGRRGSTAL